MVMYALECHEDGVWGAGRCGYACTHHPRRPPRGCLCRPPLHHHRHGAGARCLVQLLRKLWEPDVAKAEGGGGRGTRTGSTHRGGHTHRAGPVHTGHMHSAHAQTGHTRTHRQGTRTKQTHTGPQGYAQTRGITHQECTLRSHTYETLHSSRHAPRCTHRGRGAKCSTRTHPMDTPYASNILNSSPLVDSSSPSPRPNAANRSPSTGVCCRKKMRARGTWDRSGYTGGSVLPGRDPVRQEGSG